MSTIVIVAGDIQKRFISSHEYFLPLSHFGYRIMSEEAFNSIPLKAHDSLATISVLPETLFGWYLLVPMYLVGVA
jgi:hypothetical protein